MTTRTRQTIGSQLSGAGMAFGLCAAAAFMLRGWDTPFVEMLAASVVCSAVSLGMR